MLVGLSLLTFTIILGFSPETSFVSKTGDQKRVSVTAFGGRFIAVAEDSNCGKPEKHICFYSGGSEELADDSPVSTAYPGVSVDSSGNIYLVYSAAREKDPETNTISWDIYFRKKSGNIWSVSKRINSTRPDDQCKLAGDQIRPSIAVTSSGIYVVWQSIESTGRSFICFTYSPDFGITWSRNKRLFEGYTPSIAVSGSEIYIVFSDINSNVLFARSEDGGNTFTVRAEPIFTASGRIPDLAYPSIAITPSGVLIAVWQAKAIKGFSSDIDIFISMSKNKGQSWSSPRNLDLPGDQVNPSVVFSGGIFVFYSTIKSVQLGHDIYYVESRGSVVASVGENSPVGILSVASGSENITVFQMKLTATEDIGFCEVKTIKVRAIGTMNDPQDIIKVRAYLDSDMDGVVSPADTLIGEGVFAEDDGYAILPVNLTLSTEPRYVIVTVTLSKPIPRGKTFNLQIDPPSDILAYAEGTGVGVPVEGSVISGRQISISNNLPVAVASANPSSVLENSGVEVLLDASNSYDPDGDQILFMWQQLSGPPVSLVGSGSQVKFTAPSSVTRNENLVFRVTVSDSFGGSATTQVSVLVIDTLNEPPVAVPRIRIAGNLFAGPVDLEEGTVVVLDASESYDPNGDKLFYFWNQVGGTYVNLVNPAGVTSYFVAPPVICAQSETLTFNLSVRDQKGAVSSSSITVRILNTRNDPPSAKFVPTPNIGQAPLQVTFDAGASYDCDGDIISYAWDFGDGTQITTSNPVVVHNFYTPGEYLVKLRVLDNSGNFSEFLTPVTVLASVPTLFIFPVKLTDELSYGVFRNVVKIRFTNISAETIVINSVKLDLAGVPDADFEILLDVNSDGIGDFSLYSFSLKGSSGSFVIPLNLTLQGGKASDVIIRLKPLPISDIPVNYSLVLSSVNARSSFSGVDVVLVGASLPWSSEFSLKKSALIFLTPSTFAVLRGGGVIPFSVDVIGLGASFTINSLQLSYDPTKIERVSVFEDSNSNGNYDAGERILADLRGEQVFSLSLAIEKSGRKRIGFLAYPSASTGGSSQSAGNLSSLALASGAVVLVAFLIPVFRRKEIFIISALVFIIIGSCANKPGTGKIPEKEFPGGMTQYPTDLTQQIPTELQFMKTTVFYITGASVVSSSPSFEVIGLPLQVQLFY